MKPLPRYPLQADSYGARVEVGCLVALEYRPWRVREIRDLPDEQQPESALVPGRWGMLGERKVALWLRPAAADQTFASHPDDLHVTGYLRNLRRLQEHYGLCVQCGDLLPCREMEAERDTKRVTERMARYETPGVCPACMEPVTIRQERETFPNTVVPLGPPVTFHMGRRACRISAERYRDKVGQPDMQLRLDGGVL